MHHSETDVTRIYILRKEAGQGMTNLEMVFKINDNWLKQLLAVFRRQDVAFFFRAQKVAETLLSGKRKQ